MPNYCCAVGCKQKGGFRFPKNDDLNLKWRRAIRREGPNQSLWQPSKYSVLCQHHFKSRDFVVSPFERLRKTLKSNAVPSVFQFNDVEMEDSRPRCTRLRPIKRMMKREGFIT